MIGLRVGDEKNESANGTNVQPHIGCTLCVVVIYSVARRQGRIGTRACGLGFMPIRNRKASSNTYVIDSLSNNGILLVDSKSLIIYLTNIQLYQLPSSSIDMKSLDMHRYVIPCTSRIYISMRIQHIFLSSDLSSSYLGNKFYLPEMNIVP